MWTPHASNCYRVLNRELSDFYKLHSFKKLPHSTCGWYVNVNLKHFIVVFSHHKGGGDDYAGSEFRVDVQLGQTLERDFFISKNIAFYLDDSQLAKIVTLQNDVIAHLRKPDKNHPLAKILNGNTWLAKFYLERYLPITEPYKHVNNLFFRYLQEIDVINWAKFIAEILPTAMERIVKEQESL